MINYRLSYWKTTLFAAVATVFSFIVLLILWAIRQDTTVLGMTWISEVSPLFYWPVFLLGIAVAVGFLLITLGGITCLHSDAREKR